jgi:hypothetical protein
MSDLIGKRRIEMNKLERRHYLNALKEAHQAQCSISKRIAEALFGDKTLSVEQLLELTDILVCRAEEMRINISLMEEASKR